MAYALDGHAAGSATTLALTTSIANDVIVLIVSYSDSVTLNSVSDNSGVSVAWTKRAGVDNTSQGYKTEVWWSNATAAWVAKTITLSFSAGPGLLSTCAFGVSGLPNITAPWDTNGSLPATDNTGASSVTLSTSASAGAFVIGGYLCITNGGAGTGYTTIDFNNFQTTEYQVFGSAQTSLAVTAIGSASSFINFIGDALGAPSGGGGGSTKPRGLPLMGVG